MKKILESEIFFTGFKLKVYKKTKSGILIDLKDYQFTKNNKHWSFLYRFESLKAHKNKKTGILFIGLKG